MITKRYKLPLPLAISSVRDQALEYLKDDSVGLAFVGPFIEQDVQFSDTADQTILDDMHTRMVSAGWSHVEDNPADPPALVILDEDGEERKLAVTGKSLQVSLKPSKATHSLAEQKKRRIAEIDRRTEELISLGFEFPPGSGQRFSLSQDAQINLLGIDTARDIPELVYPIEFNTIDDQTTFSVDNSGILHGMFLTAMGTKRATLQSGTDLKKAIRAASDQAELDAVVDPR